MRDKAIQGVPSSETVWLDFKTSDGKRYLITSKVLRDWYYIYRVTDGKAEKLGKASSPMELEQEYIVK